jgi:hypothetical protein
MKENTILDKLSIKPASQEQMIKRVTITEIWDIFVDVTRVFSNGKNLN